MSEATAALVIHPDRPQARDGRSAEARLAEALGLAAALDLDIRHAAVAPVATPRPSTLLGGGKVEELKAIIVAEDVELAIVDAALTPVQQRNLEREWDTKVLDRTGLILEIFGARAQTREGVLQVELAHLLFQRSRLVRSWTHLERQRGGLGFIGGPGESQIEADRRQIDDRVVKLRRQLEKVVRTRSLHRAARARTPYPIVALVGYTNAGKSTLFNALTEADVRAEDMLFATLDPTMRAIRTPAGREVILSDTVGFVSNLPTQLVAAFRATLEEVLEADLIVHVRDVANPDTDAQARDVWSVMAELGVEETRLEEAITAFNKIDLLPAEERDAWGNAAARAPRTVCLSAATGEGADALMAAVDDALSAASIEREITLSSEAGEALSWLYRRGAVADREDTDTGVRLRLRLDPADAGRFMKHFGDTLAPPRD